MALVVKNLPAIAGDMGSIPGPRRSLEKFHSIKKAVKKSDMFIQSDFSEVFKEVKQLRLQASLFFPC